MFLNHKTNPLVSIPVEVVLPSRSVMYGQLRARVGAIREAKVSSVPHLRPTARVPHFHIERRRRYPVSIAVGLSYLIDCVLSLRLPPVPRAVTLVVVIVVVGCTIDWIAYGTHIFGRSRPVVPFTHSRCHRNNRHTRWTLGKSQKLASCVVSYPCLLQIRSICEPEIPTGSLPV